MSMSLCKFGTSVARLNVEALILEESVYVEPFLSVLGSFPKRLLSISQSWGSEVPGWFKVVFERL